jgi:hypothetical protein
MPAPTTETTPAPPASKPTTLTAWLMANGAQEIGHTKAPAKTQSTPGLLTCYAIDNHEIWVHAWANGQRWTILTDVGGIAGLEAFLETGEGDSV